jgi:hypothetical protein
MTTEITHTKQREAEKSDRKPINLVYEDHERGYYSSNEPYLDQVSAEMYEQVIKDHLVKRQCWIPSRF